MRQLENLKVKIDKEVEIIKDEEIVDGVTETFSETLKVLKIEAKGDQRELMEAIA